MKNLIDRLLLIIVTLLFMFTSLLLAIYSLGIVEREFFSYLLNNFYGRIELGVLFLMFFVVGARAIYPFFITKKRKKINILNHTDFGEVDITLEALENLVKGVAIQQKEIENIRTKLIPTEEGIIIYLTGKVHPSTVIPDLTEELQKVTKSYIEDTTGVNVEEVRVLIDNIYEKKDKKPKNNREEAQEKPEENQET